MSYNTCYLSLQYRTAYQIMEEDILNYSPTVMFRGTPCILQNIEIYISKGTEFFVTNSTFLISISLLSNVVEIRYFKLRILLDQII